MKVDISIEADIYNIETDRKDFAEWEDAIREIFRDDLAREYDIPEDQILVYVYIKEKE